MSDEGQRTLHRQGDDRMVTASHLVLERFDAALDAYRRGMRDAPAGALGYARAGDAYTLGGLASHVNAVLRHYTGTADGMLRAGLREQASAPDSSRLFAEAGAAAARTPSAAERDSGLAETERLHARVRELVAGVEEREWSRPVPVRFGSGDPYPTRLLDVLGWLTDHYAEHAAQAASLLGEWRTLAAVEAFNRAFAAQDVDGVMACMTEDCVFENTSPAPDGTRLTGADQVARFWREFFAATPGARWRTEEAFAAGNRAVVRWRFDWDGGEENRGHVRGVDVFRVSDGRVAEKLSYVKG